MERTNALENFRRQIDNIDNEMLILLKRRMQLSKKIAKYKYSKKLEIFDSSREDEIFHALKIKAISMALSEGFTRRLFTEIMNESKICQRDFLDKEEKRLNNSKRI